MPGRSRFERGDEQRPPARGSIAGRVAGPRSAGRRRLGPGGVRAAGRSWPPRRAVYRVLPCRASASGLLFQSQMFCAVRRARSLVGTLLLRLLLILIGGQARVLRPEVASPDLGGEGYTTLLTTAAGALGLRARADGWAAPSLMNGWFRRSAQSCRKVLPPPPAACSSESEPTLQPNLTITSCKSLVTVPRRA